VGRMDPLKCGDTGFWRFLRFCDGGTGIFGWEVHEVRMLREGASGLMRKKILFHGLRPAFSLRSFAFVSGDWGSKAEGIFLAQARGAEGRQLKSQNKLGMRNFPPEAAG